MDPQQESDNQPDNEIGESAFMSRQLREEQDSNQAEIEIEPLPRNQYRRGRKRRWFLHFALSSVFLITLGTVLINVFDRGWRKAKSVVRGFIPDSLFEDNEPQTADPSAPKHGVQKTLENEKEYREFIASLNLKYITASEVIRPHLNIRNGVKNELPPKRYWKRIKDCLLTADAIREELGVPLKAINSAYRSPDYNAQCNGAVSNSYHTKNLALDLVFACSSKEAAIAAKKLRSEGVFKGGIGVYSSFIHIDTRGRNANWGISV